MRNRGVLSSIIGLGLLACAHIAHADGQLLVPTLSGPVVGLDLGDHREWRGIPYAKVERWRRPLAPDPWATPRPAFAFGPHCPQPLDLDPSSFAEDCLFLNVSVPPDAAVGAKLPVIIDVHGGGDLFGWGRESTMSLVRHDVIVVTLNYRLGVLGFLALPELTAEGGGTSSNYGLWDQIAALTWVQNNIAFFGGDPTNVTLSGFSSGAGDGAVLVASPKARGLFVRAFLSSFEIFQVTGINQQLADLENEGTRFVAHYGCDTAPDKLACLREIPYQTLVADFGFETPQGTIEPELLPEGALYLAREHGTVPMVITNVQREDGWMVDDDTIPNPMTSSTWNLLVGDLAGANNTGVLRRLYYASSRFASTFLAYIELFLDLKHMCPSRAFALAGAASAPTWRWIFTHHLENADWPVDRWGATHGDDMALLWQDDWYPRAPDEEVLSWQLSRYMTNFAKHGDPNEPGVLFYWPQFTAGQQEYLDVEVPLTIRTRYHAQECDAIDNMYDDAFQTCSTLCRLYFRAGGRYTNDEQPFPYGIQKRFP